GKAEEHALHQGRGGVLGTPPRVGEEIADPSAQVSRGTHAVLVLSDRPGQGLCTRQEDSHARVGPELHAFPCSYQSLAASPSPRSPMKPREQRWVERGLRHSAAAYRLRPLATAVEWRGVAEGRGEARTPRCARIAA